MLNRLLWPVPKNSQYKGIRGDLFYCVIDKIQSNLIIFCHSFGRFIDKNKIFQPIKLIIICFIYYF